MFLFTVTSKVIYKYNQLKVVFISTVAVCLKPNCTKMLKTNPTNQHILKGCVTQRHQKP